MLILLEILLLLGLGYAIGWVINNPTKAGKIIDEIKAPKKDNNPPSTGPK